MLILILYSNIHSVIVSIDYSYCEYYLI